METLFHGTNVILIALVNYYKKRDEGEGWGVGWGWALIGRISEMC